MIDNDELHKKLDDVNNLFQQAFDQLFRIYMKEIIFTWQWWLGIFLSTSPWVLWFFLREKKSTWRLLAAGMSVVIISSFMDLIGVTLNIWNYNYDVFPLNPAYEPWDITLLPVTVMFLIQIKPSLNPLLKAIIFGIFSAFIAEPFFHWLDLYDPQSWKRIYSFPIYLVIYLIGHYISISKNYKELMKQP